MAAEAEHYCGCDEEGIHLRSDGAVMVLVRFWRYDNTIKLGGDQLLQCIEEG